MSEICELEDLSKDCCVNCFNGLPAYGCPKQEEESNQLRELIHKKAIKKEQRIRLDERINVIEEVMTVVKAKISEKEYPIETMVELTDLGMRILELKDSK